MVRRSLALLALAVSGGASMGSAWAGPAGGPASMAAQANRAFGLSKSAIARLDVPERAAGVLRVALALDGVRGDLELVPTTVRAAGFRVLVESADGVLREQAAAPSSTYRGRWVASEGSRAAASLGPDGLRVRVLLADGSEVWVEPLAGRIPGAVRADHVTYRKDDVIAPDVACGTDEVVDAASSGEPGDAPESGAASGGALKVAKLACDADAEYFARYGSVGAVQSRIESVINAVNLQYERDVAITHAITTIVVRTGEPDPYTTTDPQSLLFEFRNHWYANHAGVDRDMAHLFTGKNLDGSTIGIAWIGAVCSTYSYGLSQADFSSTFASTTDLVAHEAGHNWGANHCACSSYTMNPSITSSNRFNPDVTIPAIVSFRDSRTCLDDQATPPPADPADLAAAAASPSEMDLSWSDHAVSESGYEVERSTDGVSWARVASLAADSVAYADGGLAANTAYRYRVRATSGSGASGYSNEAWATTFPAGTAPVAPSGLSATSVSDDGVDLAWTDNAADETGFVVERSEQEGSWLVAAELGAGASAFADAGLQPGTTYAYRVRAVNAAGGSAWSNVASATTDAPPAFVVMTTVAEYFVYGAVAGDHTDTWAVDGFAERLTEQESGGKPARRTSRLEHVWEVAVRSGAAVTLGVRAWGGSAEDRFRFEVSTDGGSSYARMFEVPLEAPGEAQTWSLRPDTSGAVLVRVVDSDRTRGNRSLDTVWVDAIYVRTDGPGEQVQPDQPDVQAELTLAGRGDKVKGVQVVDLGWSGASGPVTVYRDGAVVATGVDGGAFTDNLGTKGGGSYTYRVYDAATGVSSAEVTVVF
jgi:hypothetical protein